METNNFTSRLVSFVNQAYHETSLSFASHEDFDRIARSFQSGSPNEPGTRVTVAVASGPVPENLPDLEITDVDVGSQDLDLGEVVSQSYRGGDEVDLEIDIDNTGSGDAGSSEAAVFLVIDGIPQEMDDNRTSALDAGRSDNNESLAFTLPNDLDAGRYTVLILVDARSQVSESDEDNNGFLFFIDVDGPAGQPDLEITDLEVNNENVDAGDTASTVYSPGDEVDVEVEIRNTGEGDAERSTAALYLTVDGRGERVDTEGTSSLDAGERDPGERLSFDLPTELSPGFYGLYVRADDGEVIEESDEGNNSRIFVLELRDDFADDLGEGDTINGIGNLQPDDRVSGVISGPESEDDRFGDRDVFRITLEQGNTYTFTLEGDSDLRDGLFTIRDGDDFDARLAQSDQGRTSELDFTAPSTGVYYIRVGTGEEGQTGAYTLQVSAGEPPQSNDDFADEPDDNDSRNGIGSLSPGSSISGEIGLADANDNVFGDKDVFRITLTGGQSYTFTLEGDSDLRDGLFTIRDGDDFDDRLAESDQGRTSELDFTAPSTGEYFIRVGTGEQGQMGDYTLRVSDGETPPPPDGADLRIINASLDETSVEQGSLVTVRWEVENIGNRSIGATNTVIRLRDPSDGSYLTNPGNGTEIFASERIRSLDPGEIDIDETESFLLPSGIETGSYQIELFSLPDGEADIDPRNNIETLSLNISDRTNYLISAPSRVDEDAGSITFTITRSGALVAETLFASTINTAGFGYATNEGDYLRNVVNVEVNFSAGETTESVTVSILDDNISEGFETFGFILQDDEDDGPRDFIASVDWTIADDDGAGDYSIAGPASFNENAGTVTFQVSRPNSSSVETIFISTVQTEGVRNQGDYTGIVNRQITFDPGATTQEFELEIIDDGSFEGSESFALIAQSDQGDRITDFLAETVFTIVDNDQGAALPTVSLSGDIEVSEGDGVAAFSVNLSEASDQTLSVRYSTLFGSASAGDGDYDGIVDQTIVFAPGETSAIVNIRILDDDRVEGTETFSIALSDAQGLSLGNDLSTVTILDNDESNGTLQGSNSLAFMATLASAAYYLNPGIEEASEVNELNSSEAAESYDMLSNLTGFQLLGSDDLPSLSLRPVPDSRFPLFGLVDGTYVNQNAAGLIGRMGDSLYIAFRGTNDSSSFADLFKLLLIGDGASPDVEHWFDMQSHYDLFRPLLAAIDEYLASDDTIEHVYLTGHSLGAAMVQAAMYENAFDDRYSATTFASPGFLGLSDEQFGGLGLDIDNFFVAGDIILTTEIAPAGVEIGNGGESIAVAHNRDYGETFGSVELHDMDLYLEIARHLDETEQSRALSSPSFGGPREFRVHIDQSEDGAWEVSLPRGLALTSEIPETVFVSTFSDEDFLGSGGSAFFHTANTTSAVYVDLAVETDVGPSSESIQRTFLSEGSGLVETGLATGDAIGTDRLVGVSSVITGPGNDQIFGNDLGNLIIAGAGDDQIFGRGGDDVFVADLDDGDDLYDGGTGNDTADYSADRDGFVANLTSGVLTGPSAGSDQLSAIENVIGGLGADSITGDGLANILSGNEGDDQLIGAAGSDQLFGGGGQDELSGGDNVDLLIGGLGDDTIIGGSNVDTAVVSGVSSQYTVTQTSTGQFTVTGPDGTDTLSSVEFLQFDDELMRLLPGSGVSVTFGGLDPSAYQEAMGNIRDFGGNALGGDGAWLWIGEVDVNGDGDMDQLLVNDAIGRFATVGTADDGLVYFEDFSWAGETRVAGIYIDPLVEAGFVERFSPFDSQQRFQNDLFIENINEVLGADDYDGDGLQEVYFALTDGTAYLRAIMEFDGNIRYANYQSEEQVREYLTSNGFDESTFGSWFARPQSEAASGMLPGDVQAAAAPMMAIHPMDMFQPELFG